MKTILIIDDEFDLTSTLKAVLETRGYRAEVCSNGREALECLHAVHPDLLLLDVMIPLGNGYEVLDRIRQVPEFETTPVVMMNCVAPPDEREVRWQGYLKKPLTLAAVVEKVEELIGPAA